MRTIYSGEHRLSSQKSTLIWLAILYFLSYFLCRTIPVHLGCFCLISCQQHTHRLGGWKEVHQQHKQLKNDLQITLLQYRMVLYCQTNHLTFHCWHLIYTNVNIAYIFCVCVCVSECITVSIWSSLSFSLFLYPRPFSIIFLASSRIFLLFLYCERRTTGKN